MCLLGTFGFVPEHQQYINLLSTAPFWAAAKLSSNLRTFVITRYSGSEQLCKPSGVLVRPPLHTVITCCGLSRAPWIADAGLLRG